MKKLYENLKKELLFLLFRDSLAKLRIWNLFKNAC